MKPFMNPRLRKSLLLVGIALIALVVAGSIQAQGTDEVVWGHVSGTECLDPPNRGTAIDGHLKYLIFDSLVEAPRHFNPDGSVPPFEPGLATAWEVSDDGLIWTFFLREGVQFQKGFGEMTADDVKFTFDRTRDPENAFPRRGEFDMIDEVVNVDDYTVEFHLVEPFAPFLLFLATQRSGYIVSRKAVEEIGNEGYCSNPIGTGAYQLENWVPGGGVETVAFEDHWNGRPVADRASVAIVPEENVQVLALLRDEIQWMRVRELSIYNSLAGQPGVQIVQHPSAAFQLWGLWLNNARPPLDDVRVRKALTYALDREAIFESFIGPMGTGVAHSIISPSHIGHLPPEDLPDYGYDPERARQLLEEAGLGDGFSISAMTSGANLNIDVLTAVQGFWAEIGVDLNIDVVESAVWGERVRASDFDFWEGGLGRADADQLLFHFDSANPASARGNYVSYVSPRVDELIALQRRAVDPEERAQIIGEIQRIVMEDLPLVPMFYLQDVTAVRDRFDVPDNMFTWYFRVDHFRLKE